MENLHVHKIPVFRGGGIFVFFFLGGGGVKLPIVFLRGAGIFLNFEGQTILRPPRSSGKTDFVEEVHVKDVSFAKVLM